MVGSYVLTPPDLQGCPRLVLSLPEGIGGGQAQRQKGFRAKIQAARRNIGFPDTGLVSIEADLQPAILVKGTRRFQLPADHGIKGRPYLLGRESVRQRFYERHLCEQMEDAEAVRQAPAYRRIG